MLTETLLAGLLHSACFAVSRLQNMLGFMVEMVCTISNFCVDFISTEMSVYGNTASPLCSAVYLPLVVFLVGISI